MCAVTYMQNLTRHKNAHFLKPGCNIFSKERPSDSKDSIGSLAYSRLRLDIYMSK